jgi:outer membrane protein assembly factor BamD (BamD/ComL family)
VKLAPLLLIAAFGAAPLQCSHEEDPALRKYETPPDALYDLAQRFKEKGETAAYRETLGYLVERYPSSRFSERAKQELAAAPAASAAP